MACNITKGLKLPCKDSRGGIKKIDFAIFDEHNFTVVAQEIATLPATLTEVFRYEVKGSGNTLVETGAINSESRTTEITQVITAVFPRLNHQTEVQLNALEAGRVIAFVHNFNGDVKVVGIDSGLDATTSVGQTGGVGTDLSGYNITLESKDSKRAPFLSNAAKTALEALVSDEVIVP